MDLSYYWNLWPIGDHIISELSFSLEQIEGHLVGNWYGRTDNSWVAIVTKPIIPTKLPYPREPRFRVEDEARLVAGTIPEVYQVHVVSGDGWSVIKNTKRAKIETFGCVTVYHWIDSLTLVRFTDKGSDDPAEYEPGGEVILASMFSIGVDGDPRFPLRLPKWTKKSDLPVICSWLDYHAE